MRFLIKNEGMLDEKEKEQELDLSRRTEELNSHLFGGKSCFSIPGTCSPKGYIVFKEDYATGRSIFHKEQTLLKNTIASNIFWN